MSKMITCIVVVVVLFVLVSMGFFRSANNTLSYWRFVHVKREFFLHTVIKRLLTAGWSLPFNMKGLEMTVSVT